MYNAMSRNSSKVWWNQSHLIPKWTQESSILENLCTNWSKSLSIASYFPPLACVKMCDLRFVDCANLLLQESKGQTYGLSPVWMRTWVRRLKSNENLFPQPSNVHCWEKAIQCITRIITQGKRCICFTFRDLVLLLIHVEGLFIPGYPQHTFSYLFLLIY